MSVPGMRVIHELATEWLEAWRTLELDRTYALYDADYSQFCFQPMDLQHPLTNVEGARQYGEFVQTNILEEIQDLSLVDISYDSYGDAKWAYAICHHKALYKGADQPVLAPVRITFIARRSGGGWKLICVHQSTQQGLSAGVGRAENVFSLQSCNKTTEDNASKAIAKELAETFTKGWEDLRLEEGVYTPWDRDHDKLIYMALEGPQVLRRWRAVERYSEQLRWRLLGSDTRFRWAELTPEDICGGIVGDGLLWFHCRRDWDTYRLSDPNKKIGGMPYRETWMAHEKNGAWKVFHYHESMPGRPLSKPYIDDSWPD